MNSNIAARMIVTLTIWIGVFALIGTSLTAETGPITQANPGELLGLTAILIIGAALGTGAVWAGAGRTAQEDDSRNKGKRVHPSRVQRLIEGLDDDEVYELEALLLTRDDQADRAHRAER